MSLVKSSLSTALMSAGLSMVQPAVYRRGLVAVRVKMENNVLDFALDIADPGRVLEVFFAEERHEVVVSGRPPITSVVPVLMMDTVPGAQRRHHEYTWIPEGMIVETPYELIPIGVYMMPNGKAAALYEKVIPEDMQTLPTEKKS